MNISGCIYWASMHYGRFSRRFVHPSGTRRARTPREKPGHGHRRHQLDRAGMGRPRPFHVSDGRPGPTPAPHIVPRGGRLGERSEPPLREEHRHALRVRIGIARGQPIPAGLRIGVERQTGWPGPRTTRRRRRRPVLAGCQYRRATGAAAPSGGHRRAAVKSAAWPFCETPHAAYRSPASAPGKHRAVCTESIMACASFVPSRQE